MASLLWLVNQKMETYYWGGQRSAKGCCSLKKANKQTNKQTNKNTSTCSRGVGVCVGGLPSLFEGRDDVQAPVSSVAPFILQLWKEIDSYAISCAKPAASALNHAHPSPLLPSCVGKLGFPAAFHSRSPVTWVLTSRGWLRAVRPWWGFEGGCAAAASSSRLFFPAAAGIMQHLRPWRALLLLSVLYQPGTSEKYGKMRRGGRWLCYLSTGFGSRALHSEVLLLSLQTAIRRHVCYNLMSSTKSEALILMNLINKLVKVISVHWNVSKVCFLDEMTNFICPGSPSYY